MSVLASLSRPLILAVGLLLLLAAPAAAGSVGIAPHWEGSYFYGDARQAVPFTLDIKNGNGKIWGRISEPATFGNGSALMLHANVAGSFDGSNITFVKTYDGTGGQTHSVTYTGTVSSDARHMSGRWSLSGSSGAFNADAR